MFPSHSVGTIVTMGCLSTPTLTLDNVLDKEMITFQVYLPYHLGFEVMGDTALRTSIAARSRASVYAYKVAKNAELM